jgi:tetratricopeptide (TPR) repeat protein
MQPADIVADRFELIRVAGAGGMGEVWQARDRVADAIVALKLLTGTSASAREGFGREALILAELRHPGIVRYVAHGLTPAQHPYLVMEWLEGEELQKRLARGRLGVEQTLALLSQVAGALATAHARGVIHRDIKPSNLFLPGCSLDAVKLLDFGIARPGADAMRRTHTHSGSMVGTPGYMAPEQARGEEDVDARADVFALGCVAFECLTGRRAFDGEHAMAVFAKILLEDIPRIADFAPDVPADVDALVHRMLSKERAERPRDAAELASALSECSRHQAAPHVSLAPALTRGEQRFLGVVVVPAFDPSQVAALETDAVEMRAIRAVAERCGAKLEFLAEGSLLAVLSRRGGASDLAAQAAQCALAMRGALPQRPMALAMARGEVGARLAAEAIDRAARLLVDLDRRPAVAGLADGRARDATAGIFLDEATAALLDTRFELVRGGGSVELRRELVFEEAPRTLLGKVTECVGRDREIASLAAIFGQCAIESVARAVLVTAPAGVGKSRLRNELVNRVRNASEAQPAAREIWTTRADPMRAGSAFGLLAQMLRQACGIAESEPIAVQQERLRARITRCVAHEPQRVIEFLGELIDAPFDDRDSPQLRAARQDAMLLGDQIRRAWEDFIRAESEIGPVLMILEDLHWGDLATVKLMDSLLRNLRDRPIMVLAFARPEVHERFPKLWAEREAQEVRLAGLTRKACTRIVRNALDSSVSDDTVARIVERAEGNAFYLEELIRTIAERRGSELPETIVAMVQARLDRLDGAARRILRAASVFGQTFWKGAATELLGGATDVDDWLLHLCDEEIIAKKSAAKFASEDEYSFRHALLREGAYAMLTEDDRALGHRLAGAWLDRRGEREAIVVAEHFELGGDRKRALTFYPRAAEQALQGNDLEAVLVRIERGVACGAEGPELGTLRGIQAEAHNWRGENAEGERRALEAMALLEPGSAAWYDAAREGIITASKLGRDDAVAAIVETARRSPSDPAATHARRMALGWGATSLLFGGRLAAAEAILGELALPEHAPPRPDARVEAVIAKSRGVLAIMQQRPGALELLEQSLAGFVEAGDVRNACQTRSDVAVVCLDVGAYEQAEPLLRRSLAEAEQLSLYTTIPQVKVSLGAAMMGVGNLDDARTTLAEAVAALDSEGHRRMQGAARGYLALALSKLCDFEAAERAARETVELLQGTAIEPFALGVLASILLKRERPDQALEAAERAMAQFREFGSLEEGESRLRLAYAEALDKLGDSRAAPAMAEAKQALLARADAIADPARRQTFLERIEENYRTLALARS